MCFFFEMAVHRTLSLLIYITEMIFEAQSNRLDPKCEGVSASFT